MISSCLYVYITPGGSHRIFQSTQCVRHKYLYRFVLGIIESKCTLHISFSPMYLPILHCNIRPF